MNKKVVIGCLIAFVVVAIAAAILLYFFVVRPAGEYIASLGEIAEVSELNQDVQNQASYSPPQDGLLTEQQVQRFIRVHQHIESALGTRSNELKAKYENMTQGAEPGFREILEMLKDLSSLIKEAKAYQVEGLNQENFSLEEYRWVRNQIYQALGANVVNLNLEKITEAIQTQNPEILTEKPEVGSVPEANRTLVEENRSELTKTLAFVWLGL